MITLDNIEREVFTNSKILDAFLVRLEAVEKSQGVLLAATNEAMEKLAYITGLLSGLNSFLHSEESSIDGKLDTLSAQLQATDRKLEALIKGSADGLAVELGETQQRLALVWRSINLGLTRLHLDGPAPRKAKKK